MTLWEVVKIQLILQLPHTLAPNHFLWFITRLPYLGHLVCIITIAPFPYFSHSSSTFVYMKWWFGIVTSTTDVFTMLLS